MEGQSELAGQPTRNDICVFSLVISVNRVTLYPDNVSGLQPLLLDKVSRNGPSVSHHPRGGRSSWVRGLQTSVPHSPIRMLTCRRALRRSWITPSSSSVPRSRPTI